MAHLVLGISGASGITLSHRALHWLASEGHTVHLVVSKAAFLTASLEMGPEYASIEGFLSGLSNEALARVEVHRNTNLAASISSGSVPTDGMLLMPCSMATLAAVAIGLSDNLMRRAAEVTLKERRKLVVVPRETPLTQANLDNMVRITQMGGVIVPPVPAWYNNPKTLEDVELFIVGRALDALGVPAPPYKRWS